MTDKKTEAMKLALEALEANQPVNYCMNNNGEKFPMMQEDPFRFERNSKAITVLREALAEQPAQQEPVALPEKIYEFVPTPEPEKWHHPECEGECIACLIERVVQEAYGSQGLSYLQRHLTSPPAQRKPLTPLEIENLRDEHLYSVQGVIQGHEAFARAIEAKLKEKNNG